MAAKLGEVLVEVGADMKAFEKSMQEIERRTMQTASKVGDSFDMMERQTRRYANRSAKDMRNLPEHLKPFANSLHDTRKNFKLLERESTQSLEEMAKAVTQTRVGFDKLTSATASGKQAIKMMQELGDTSKETRLAVMGLNKDGTVAISAEESTKQLKKFQQYVDSTKLSLEKLRDAGDMGSYTAGMQQLEYEMKNVDKAMRAVAMGGNAYTSELEKMGIMTEAVGNRATVAMERMRESMVNSNNILQAKTTQSQRVIDNLGRMDIRGLDQQFLKIGNSLEKMAKQGTAVNVAFKELGDGASMSDIQKQIQMINMGIMRMTSVTIASGIAFGLLTYGLGKMAMESTRLGESMKQAGSAWTQALDPFIQSWGEVAAKLFDGLTAIANFIIKLNELNPAISTTAGWFIYLTTLMALLNAPLAIGISRAGSMAVAFNNLWMIIAPFVTGLLAVIGTAMLMAGAIIAVTHALTSMWQESLFLRTVVADVWATVKNIVMDAVNKVVTAWQGFMQELQLLTAAMTGGTGTMSEVWKLLGDTLGRIIKQIASVLLPALNLAFDVMAQAIVLAIEGLMVVVKWMADTWNQHGDTIKKIVKIMWDYIVQAFTAVSSFIGEIAPLIFNIVKNNFELMKTAVQLVMSFLKKLIDGDLGIISDIFNVVFPFILALVKDTWENIKSAIKNALTLINSAIQLFTNILKGDWSAAWDNIKSIVESALGLVWDLLNIWLLGKVLKILKGFGGQIKGALSDVADAITKPFKDGYEKAMGWVDKIKTAISDMKSAIDGAVDKAGNFISGTVQTVTQKVTGKAPNKNATGNVFTGASLLDGGRQMVGEAGAEIVMPIQRKRYMKPYASMVASLMNDMGGSSTGGGITQNINITSHAPMSPTEIARKQVQASRKLAKEWGV